jgi:tetratricopeptide (TPR) repeat protein
LPAIGIDSFTEYAVGLDIAHPLIGYISFLKECMGLISNEFFDEIKGNPNFGGTRMITFPRLLMNKMSFLPKVLASSLIILTIPLSHPEAKAQNSSVYIPSLNAKVTSFRFFEGSYISLPQGQRVYENLFEKSKTRYIFWELALEHTPPPSRRINFTIVEVWYGPDNKVITTQNFNSFVEPGWSGSYLYHGYGWKEPGKWSTGTYRVDLYIEGAQVATGSFEIYAPTAPKRKEGKQTTIFGEADKVEEYSKQAEVYLEKGDIDNYNLTLDKLANAYSARGAFRYSKGDFKGALGDLNEALLINPKLVNTYLIRGYTRFELGDLNGAIQDYSQVILMEPDNAVAYRYRGVARLANKDSSGFDDLEIAAILYKKEGNEEGYQQVQEIIKRLKS